MHLINQLAGACGRRRRGGQKEKSEYGRLAWERRWKEFLCGGVFCVAWCGARRRDCRVSRRREQFQV
ncbi:hypothetical protein KC19_10G077200 [Ceratodon purpureus]|uniref:Uncharacterized protein n=1 Tax=Ceratodon purpureus TaxID=3225 RepID=A0A8T0GMU6_CERPU|nr:hypothetical protein KC19_10G077200 [Ceratodon purpureus]